MATHSTGKGLPFLSFLLLCPVTIGRAQLGVHEFSAGNNDRSILSGLARVVLEHIREVQRL